jgi:hypothetical protein
LKGNSYLCRPTLIESSRLDVPDSIPVQVYVVSFIPDQGIGLSAQRVGRKIERIFLSRKFQKNL